MSALHHDETWPGHITEAAFLAWLGLQSWAKAMGCVAPSSDTRYLSQ
jgi:hypothetical protein